MEEGWERPPRLELSREEIRHLIEPAFPGASLVNHAVLGTGLANTNIRFWLRGHGASYVLRLYTREPKAAARERDLIRHLVSVPQQPIPLAPLLYSDVSPASGQHPYSIWEFVQGTLLQDLFKTLAASQLVEIAYSCGRVAAAFTAYRFPTCGEFGPKLETVEEYGDPSQFVPAAVHEALFGGLAGQRLGSTLRDSLWRVVERTSPMLREIDGRYTLVHADYKRSNLLLGRSGTTWTITAVLDWEFACAAPPLIDIGLFLRAGNALPAGFRDAFVGGYQDAGAKLPSEWLRLSRLVDLLSQVTFLNDPRDRPRVVAETTSIVEETVQILA
jgi:aminoglycoside phosphotransferase (APT) family kinase protein